MRLAVVAVVLILSGCTASAPRASASPSPSAGPTPVVQIPTPSPTPTATPSPTAPRPWTQAEAVMVDHQPPWQSNAINSVSCPSSSLCVAVEYGNVITSTNPSGGAAAWTVTNVDGLGSIPYLSVVSCPTDAFCAALDTNSQAVATSTDPAGGAATWKVTKLLATMGLIDLSCPSASLCVGVGGDATVVTSRNPTGGPSTWTAVHLAGLPFCAPPGEGSLPCGLTGVSCPTEAFCAAVDTVGDLVTSPNPTGGAAAWKVTPLRSVVGDKLLSGVSCVGPQLCVLLGYTEIFTSTTPTGGAATWKLTRLTVPGPYLTALSCPTSTFCVAADLGGDVITSSNPTGGAAAWRVTNLASDPAAIASGVRVALTGVSCPDAGFCAAVDGGGDVLTSANPAGGAAGWTKTNVDSSNQLFGVSCPSTRFCAAVDRFGNVVTSTDPPGDARSWTVASLTEVGANPMRLTPDLLTVSCPSISLCVALDGTYAGHVFTSTDPARGAESWSLTVMGGIDEGIRRLSCPSVRLCIAPIGARLLTSSDPTGGSAAWKVFPLAGVSNYLVDASCPDATFCVALDYSGNVFTSMNPSGGSAAWKKVARVTLSGDTRLSCPSKTLCVAINASGEIVTGSPLAGSVAWKSTHIAGDYHLTALSCPSVHLCVAVGYGGSVLTSINPTGGSTAWKSTHAAGSNFLIDVSCVSTLCVAVDTSGKVIVGTTA